MIYPIWFFWGIFLNWYAKSINYFYISHRLLIECLVWIALLWIPIIAYCKWRRKDKLLLFVFGLAAFILYGKQAGAFCLPYLGNLPLFYSYRYLWALIAFFAFILLWIGIRNKNFWNRKTSSFLSVVCFIFFIVSATQAILVIYRYTIDPPRKAILPISNKNRLPNIYHICLDMHVGYEGLQLLNYDSSKFYRQLNELGFWYDLASRSNYPFTIATFASMFSMDYLEDDNIHRALSLIRGRTVALDILKEQGYRTIHYSRWNALHFNSFDQDLYNTSKYFPMLEPWGLGSFLSLLIKNYYNKVYIKAVLSGINDICSAKDIHGPEGNYFFFHILCPHWPYIWSQHSWIECHPNLQVNKLPGKDFPLHDFSNQYKHIDSLIVYAIREVLNSYDNTDVPPIIILHGDHGLSRSCIPLNIEDKSKIEFSNLYAIYMPQQYQSALPPPPGLVNTFRWLFNTLFKAQYSYLESKQIPLEW